MRYACSSSATFEKSRSSEDKNKVLKMAKPINAYALRLVKTFAKFS